MLVESTDVAVVGCGFYGAFVAHEIKSRDPALDVVVVERADTGFTRASSTNQGQFHLGYMYSADRELAAGCAANAARFSRDFGAAVDERVASLYGIHRDSAIDAGHYEEFCAELGLPLRPVDRPADVFGDAVTSVYATAEKTFDSTVVQKILAERIAVRGVRLRTGFDVRTVTATGTGLRLAGKGRVLDAATVFNVTFADLNALHDRSGLPRVPLRYDTFLHFVLDLPDVYRDTAATVVRGPFASLLPSSLHQGHVLASGAHRRVRTSTTTRPTEAVGRDEVAAVYRRAVREATPYLPLLGSARLRGHTIGTRAALLDPRTGTYTSRAVVVEDVGGLRNYHAVLGGKVSCVFDVATAVGAIMKR